MKRLPLLLLLLPLFAFHPGIQVLLVCKYFKANSYYKEQVYAEHDWKTFYALPQPKAVIDPGRYDVHLMNACLFFATNKLRAYKNIPPLEYSGQLTRAAAVHSHEMATRKFFSHYNSINKSLYSPWIRIHMFGDVSNYSAENCALDYSEFDEEETYIHLAEKVIQSLYNSPGHRKNMLNPVYSRLGCGSDFIPIPGREAVYVKVTQDFTGD